MIMVREDWQNSNFQSIKTGYTDESGANVRFRIGIYDSNANHEKSISIGRLSTVFQAKVLAISR